jgi:UDP-N-acetyl-D-galactosamine dehydrogenase
LLMLGITFKENCPDVRNTKVADLIFALQEYGMSVTIYDTWANPKEVQREYNLASTTIAPEQQFDAVVLGVAHSQFLETNLIEFQKETSIIYDVKGVLTSNVDAKL